MTDDSRICRYCGKPTEADEFFNGIGKRVWAHIDCMRKEAAMAIASGEVDNVSIAINRPDGITEIRTGKQLREAQEQKRKQGKRR